MIYDFDIWQFCAVLCLAQKLFVDNMYQNLKNSYFLPTANKSTIASFDKI